MNAKANPQISIVVTCYNRRDYLRQCLQSIVERAEPGWDVLVVDDGSTESIRDVVDQFAPLVRYVWQPNAGLGAARNTGVRETQGRYIKFIDDDDLLLSVDVLLKQVDLLDREPRVGLVHAQAVKIDEHGNRRGIFKPSWADAGYVHSGDVEIERLLIQNHILPSTVVVRRDVFAGGMAFKTYPTAQDWDCWLRIARMWSIAYIAEPVVKYRMHQDTISGRKTEALVIQVHEDVIQGLFADAEFARRYAHLLGPVHAHLDVLAASVAHRRRRPLSCMKYASRGLVRSLKYRRWEDARRASECLLKSLVPLPVRDLRRWSRSQRAVGAGLVAGSASES